MPKGIRPTQDKVRKALFDMLSPVIRGSVFLDLFAGSASVGLEALSRGADEVILVESHPASQKIIRENLKNLTAEEERERISLLPMDSQEAVAFWFKKGKRFDIIFLDPPYYAGLAPRLRSGLATINNQGSLAKKALLTLAGCDILSSNGLIVVQHHKKDLLPQEAGFLRLMRQKRYSDTILSFYAKIL